MHSENLNLILFFLDKKMKENSIIWTDALFDLEDIVTNIMLGDSTPRRLSGFAQLITPEHLVAFRILKAVMLSREWVTALTNARQH
jgi:hypothetical protein